MILYWQFFSLSLIKVLFYHLLVFYYCFWEASSESSWHWISKLSFQVFWYLLFTFGVLQLAKYVLNWIHFYLSLWDLRYFLNLRIHVCSIWEKSAIISSNITSSHSCISTLWELWLDVCNPFSFYYPHVLTCLSHFPSLCWILNNFFNSILQFQWLYIFFNFWLFFRFALLF